VAVLCDNATHLIAAVVVGLGPKNDSPDLPPLVGEAMRRVPIRALYADAGYDSEAHHRLCREELGIEQTAIPVNYRGRPWTVPTTPYRAEMAQSFPDKEAAQRWQVESDFSRIKRRLGSSLRARSHQTRTHECHIRVITHDLMILLPMPN
jgi:hypothetical protein